MPTFWQWFFSIIGLVAFLMAFPFFLQLFLAQPRIGISFSHDDMGKEGRIIKLHLMNIPIDNWLLKILKVSRLSAQDVYLSVRVFDASNRQVVIDTFMPAIELSPFSKDGRVNLPSSILNANVKLAKWQRSTNSAVLISQDKLIPLREGTYLFTIGIGIDARNKYLRKPVFLHIGKSEADMVWDENITHKILLT